MKKLIQKLIHAITLTDSNVIAQCDKLSKTDRINMYWSFIALSLHMVFMTCVMAYAATMIIDNPYIQFLAGFILAAMILQFEVRLVGSDWDLHGILRPSGLKHSLGLLPKFLLRLGISLIFAFGLFALPIELKIQETAIMQVVEQQIRVGNDALFNNYGNRITQQKSVYDKAQNTLNEMNTRRKHLSKEKRSILADLKAQSSIAAKAEQEMFRQEHGVRGRSLGKGKLYLDAKKSYDIAQNAISRLNGRITDLEAEMNVIDDSINHQQARVSNSWAKLEMSQDKDPRFAPTKAGLLARYMVLRQIHRDPEKGTDARFLGIMIKITLIALELLPLLGKCFSPASLYNVLMTNKIRLEALRANLAYSETVRALTRNGIKPEKIQPQPSSLTDDEDVLKDEYQVPEGEMNGTTPGVSNDSLSGLEDSGQHQDHGNNEAASSSESTDYTKNPYQGLYH